MKTDVVAEALERVEAWLNARRQHGYVTALKRVYPKAGDTRVESVFLAHLRILIDAVRGSSQDLAPQPEPLTVPETPRHADALQDRIGERIADEVEKACHGRQTNCEQAAADILAMLKGGAS